MAFSIVAAGDFAYQAQNASAGDGKPPETNNGGKKPLSGTGTTVTTPRGTGTASANWNGGNSATETSLYVPYKASRTSGTAESVSYRHNNGAAAYGKIGVVNGLSPRGQDASQPEYTTLHGLLWFRVDGLTNFINNNGTSDSDTYAQYYGIGNLFGLHGPWDATNGVEDALVSVRVEPRGEEWWAVADYTGNSNRSDPDLLLGAIRPTASGVDMWYVLEWAFRQDDTGDTIDWHSRLITPEGTPHPWVRVDDISYTADEGAVYWSYCFPELAKQGTTVSRVWNKWYIGKYIIADSTDYWSAGSPNYDTDGVGNDKLDRTLEVHPLHVDTGDTFGTLGGGAWTDIDELPWDYSSYAQMPATNGVWAGIKLTTNGLASSDVDEVLCVNLIAMMSNRTQNTQTWDGSFGLADGSSPTNHTTKAINVDGYNCYGIYNFPHNLVPSGDDGDSPSGSAWTYSDLDDWYARFRRDETANLSTYGIGAYVVYRPSQTAPGTTVGELTAAPTVTAPAGACDEIVPDWEARMTVGDPPGVQRQPVFAAYNRATGKVYAGAWGDIPLHASSYAYGGSSSTEVPCVYELDPSESDGAPKVVWQADDNYTSIVAGGPDKYRTSGNYRWTNWLAGDGDTSWDPNEMRIHNITVDNHELLEDGSTANPFYGAVLVCFSRDAGAGANATNPCKGLLALFPTRDVTGTPFASARPNSARVPGQMLAMDVSTELASDESSGALGVGVNEDWICCNPNQVNHTEGDDDAFAILEKDSVTWLDSDNTSTSTPAEYFVPAMPDDQSWTWKSVAFGLYTTLVNATNQIWPGWGFVWLTGGGIRRFRFDDVSTFDASDYATATVEYGSAYQASAHYKNADCRFACPVPMGPDGNHRMLVTLGWGQGATGSLYFNSRVRYTSYAGLGATAARRDQLAIGVITDVGTPASPASLPTNGVDEILRIPIELADDAQDDSYGRWTSNGDNHWHCWGIVPLTWEYWLVCVGETDDVSGAGTLKRRGQLLMVHYPSRKWWKVQPPYQNCLPFFVEPLLLEDQGRRTSTPYPDNRNMQLLGDQTVDDDLYRFLMVDQGQWDTDGTNPITYHDGSTTDLGEESLGGVSIGQIAPPVLAQSDVGVTFTIDLPSGKSAARWRVEVGGDSDNKLGVGVLVDGGEATAESAGGTVAVQARIPRNAYPHAELDGKRVHVYWSVTDAAGNYTVWSAEATS